MKMVKLLAMVVLLCCAGAANAGWSYSQDFESATYVVGDSLDGVDGWTVTLPPQALYWGKTVDSWQFPIGGNKAAGMLSYPSTNVTLERTINPDEDLLTASWLWLPDDNGSPASWGAANMFLEDDTGNYYFYAWYRVDQPL